MSNPSLTAVLLVGLTIPCGTCFAQSQATDQSQKTGQASAGAVSSDESISIVDAVEAEYRDLICSRAADISHPDQMQAIKVAVSQKYADSRFNDSIRRVLKKSTQPDDLDLEAVSKAMMLLPLATLEPNEQTELVFHCYLACVDANAGHVLRQQLKQVLQNYPNETSRLVHEQLKNTDGLTRLFELVGIVGDSSEASLPILMRYARSEDKETSARAIDVIPVLIKQLRSRERALRKLAETKKLGVEDLDPKMVTYASRIISRYDTNGDLQLTAPEYQNMLMSPAEADSDGDGKISVTEYAAWMQSRTARGR